MDFSKLRTGELIAGICGVLLLIVMFISWYGVGGSVGDFAEAAGVDTSVSAWGAFSYTDLILFITAAVAIGAGVLAATGRSVALPVAASVIVTILGILAALLVLYRIINQPGPNEVIDVRFGAYLGLLLCIGIAAGGFMAMSDEGTSLGDAARRVQGADDATAPGGGAPAGAQTPPPPAAPTAPPATPPGAGAPPAGADPTPPPSPPPGEPPRQG